MDYDEAVKIYYHKHYTAAWRGYHLVSVIIAGRCYGAFWLWDLSRLSYRDDAKRSPDSFYVRV